MDAFSVLLVLGAGVAGGAIAGMVGGGSIITFPVMLAVGLPPIVATASNIVALTVANIAGVFAALKHLPSWDKSFVALAACSILGSAVGAVFLLIASETWFALAIPVLMGVGTATFAFSEQIKQWMTAQKSLSAETIQCALVAATAVYGSFFGASFTVLLLAVISLTVPDLRAANVIKNLLGGLIGVVAIIIFLIGGVVGTRWVIAPLPTLFLTIGAVVGGYMGGWLVTVIPRQLMRWLVIAIGVLLTIYYARRYWFA
jgi:uncharacterized membrane protein YfcA